MKSPEVDKFEKLVRDNQATIYSVCYMYSNDDDEVADLFQECLINIWKALPGFRNGSKDRHVDLQDMSQHLHQCRPKEEVKTHHRKPRYLS